MSTKLSFVVLFACVLAMQFGLLASVPMADAILPWVAAFAVVSVCWPIVSFVLGLFGVLVIKEDDNGRVHVNMNYEYDRPGHKFGYLLSLAVGRSVRFVRSGMAAGFNKLGKWTEPKKGKARRVIVQPLFKD